MIHVSLRMATPLCESVVFGFQRYNCRMTTKLTDEQRRAIEACAGQPVLVADDATQKVYYLLNEEAFAHLCGLQSGHDEACQAKLRALIAEGIQSGEIPADRAFNDLRAEMNQLINRIA
jgi:hypothetical protein